MGAQGMKLLGLTAEEGLVWSVSRMDMDMDDMSRGEGVVVAWWISGCQSPAYARALTRRRSITAGVGLVVDLRYAVFTDIYSTGISLQCTRSKRNTVVQLICSNAWAAVKSTALSLSLSLSLSSLGGPSSCGAPVSQSGNITTRPSTHLLDVAQHHRRPRTTEPLFLPYPYLQRAVVFAASLALPLSSLQPSIQPSRAPLAVPPPPAPAPQPAATPQVSLSQSPRRHTQCLLGPILHLHHSAGTWVLASGVIRLSLCLVAVGSHHRCLSPLPTQPKSVPIPLHRPC
ncbi:hypothetical protein BC567DRAFT_39833 [Phyllosticta citribraziliensis]